jgi:hypothetical protein
MAKLFFKTFFAIIILILVIGSSDTNAVGELKTVSLTVEGMTWGA